MSLCPVGLGRWLNAARGAARWDQILERRNAFQRQTLLDLQEALMKLGRTCGQMHHQDVMTYRQTGEWQCSVVSEIKPS